MVGIRGVDVLQSLGRVLEVGGQVDVQCVRWVMRMQLQQVT